MTSSIIMDMVMDWTVADVGNFLREKDINDDDINRFQENGIDGRSMLTLTERMIERLFSTIKEETKFIEALRTLQARSTESPSKVKEEATTSGNRQSEDMEFGDVTSFLIELDCEPTSNCIGLDVNDPPIPSDNAQVDPQSVVISLSASILTALQSQSMDPCQKSEVRKGLVIALYETLSSKALYPSHKEYMEILDALTTQYPYLKVHKDLLHTLLITKFKKERQTMTDNTAVQKMREVYRESRKNIRPKYRDNHIDDDTSSDRKIVVHLPSSLRSFPTYLIKALRKEDRELKQQTKLRSCLMEALYDSLSSVALYPTHENYTSIVNDLTVHYPFLKDSMDVIHESLRSKFKRNRGLMRDDGDVKKMKERYRLSRENAGLAITNNHHTSSSNAKTYCRNKMLNMSKKCGGQNRYTPSKIGSLINDKDLMQTLPPPVIDALDTNDADLWKRSRMRSGLIDALHKYLSSITEYPTYSDYMRVVGVVASRYPFIAIPNTLKRLHASLRSQFSKKRRYPDSPNKVKPDETTTPYSSLKGKTIQASEKSCHRRLLGTIPPHVMENLQALDMDFSVDYGTRSQIVKILFDSLSSVTLYPSHVQYVQIIKQLTKYYPSIKMDENTREKLHNSLISKFKIQRAMMKDLGVVQDMRRKCSFTKKSTASKVDQNTDAGYDDETDDVIDDNTYSSQTAIPVLCCDICDDFHGTKQEVEYHKNDATSGCCTKRTRYPTRSDSRVGNLKRNVVVKLEDCMKKRPKNVMADGTNMKTDEIYRTTNKNHTKTAKSKTIIRKAGISERCHQCHKVFKTDRGLLAHMLAHEDCKAYFCTECGVDFTVKTDLIKHMSIHDRLESKGGRFSNSSKKINKNVDKDCDNISTSISGGFSNDSDEFDYFVYVSVKVGRKPKKSKNNRSNTQNITVDDKNTSTRKNVGNDMDDNNDTQNFDVTISDDDLDNANHPSNENCHNSTNAHDLDNSKPSSDVNDLITANCSLTDKDTVNDPGVTDPGVTDPCVTDQGVTDADVTDPGVTDPVVTDPDVTDNLDCLLDELNEQSGALVDSDITLLERMIASPSIDATEQPPNKASPEADEMKNDDENLAQSEQTDEKSSTKTTKMSNIKCPLCNERFKCHSDKRKHVAQVHRTQCVECEQSYFSLVNLNQHIATKHRPNIDGKSNGTFNSKSIKHCYICDKEFGTRHSFLRHMNDHTNAMFYTHQTKCLQCGKQVADEVQLMRHIRNHDLIDSQFNIQCEMCGKILRHKNSLTKHLLLHTKEKKFRCLICDMRFTHGGNLRSHMISHSNQLKFVCAFCRKRFKRKHSLMYHIRTHTNTRPFKCYVCKLAFRDSSALHNHKRTHTGEKRHLCKICGTAYSHPHSLKLHISKIHDVA